MTRPWRHADFAALVGCELALRGEDGAEDLRGTVTACTDLTRTGDIETYHVTLVAGPGAPRTQGVFEIAGPGGAEPIFLVPHRTVGDTVEYTAIFNQLVQDGSES